jgi:hypothetical protein
MALPEIVCRYALAFWIWRRSVIVPKDAWRRARIQVDAIVVFFIVGIG